MRGLQSQRKHKDRQRISNAARTYKTTIAFALEYARKWASRLEVPVEYLTVDELFAFLAGTKYTLLLEPPRELLPAGAIGIWPQCGPLDAAARLIPCPEWTSIEVQPDVWAALKELESVGGVC